MTSNLDRPCYRLPIESHEVEYVRIIPGMVLPPAASHYQFNPMLKVNGSTTTVNCQILLY